VERNARSSVERNSPPLSHCEQRRVVWYWVVIKEKKRNNVAHVSDLACKGKIQEKWEKSSRTTR
jgi:hypothetical protein